MSPCQRINSNLVFFMIMPALYRVNKIRLKQVSTGELFILEHVETLVTLRQTKQPETPTSTPDGGCEMMLMRMMGSVLCGVYLPASAQSPAATQHNRCTEKYKLSDLTHPSSSELYKTVRARPTSPEPLLSAPCRASGWQNVNSWCRT